MNEIKPNYNIKIWEKTGGKCWYCGRDLNPDFGRETAHGYKIAPNSFTVDHVIPKRHGGPGHIKNLVPACRRCNGMKRTMSLEEFRDSMTRLENNAPKFTPEQLFYLDRIGVELPDYEPHVFYFEREGLQL